MGTAGLTEDSRAQGLLQQSIEKHTIDEEGARSEHGEPVLEVNGFSVSSSPQNLRRWQTRSIARQGCVLQDVNADATGGIGDDRRS